MKTDERAIVLDFLPQGKSTGFRAVPLAQVVGTEFFTLLEVVPKTGVSLRAGMEVYIGKGERKEIELIKRRISFKDLTSNSAAEIEKIIEQLVVSSEKKFVDFFNNSQSITIKRHQLELLPGLGKKHMMQIIKERENAPFAGFKDIEERVKLMPNVVRTIVKRVIEELEGEDERYYLFAKPMPKKDEQFERRQRF